MPPASSRVRPKQLLPSFEVYTSGPGFRLIGGAAVLGSQWDNEDGQAAAGCVKDCGVGEIAFCMAGASCDWWGGNIKKLINPGCRIHRSPLPGQDVQDAWPPVK